MDEATTTPLEELLPWLNRIDTLIQKAVLLAESHYSPDPATAPYRGLQISLEEVDLLLQRHPAEPLFGNATKETASPPATSRLAWLQQQFQLTPIDLDILALALAPNLDRRYERLYAYLQDDIRAKHPTVDLALNLLSPTAGDKLQQRDRFSPDAPLIRHHLLHLHSQPDTPTPLLAQTLHLDAQIVRYLLGNNGLDSRLSNFCQLIHPTLTLNQLFLNPELQQKLSALAENHQHLRLYFQGTDTSSKRRAAEALAQELHTPLLAADISRLTTNPKTDIEPTLNLLWREAWFQNALLYLDGWDNLPASDRALASDTLLATPLPLTILCGTEPWNPISGILGVVTVPIPLPDFLQRRHCWQTHLKSAGISLTDSDLYAIADRFRLTSDRIADAVATACNQIRVEGKKDTEPKIADLFAAARAQSGHDLTRLARPIEPKYRLEDIVLPIEQKTQLREICDRATHQTKVLSEWGFDNHLSMGKGLNVLFSGVPGTGKTMAAEAIARELQLDLYKIDLSQIVSKYIGETEKNLDRIFTAAATSNAILLFDEADALFGKRSEVKDARDRYANIEIGYLLQKMEEYEGIAILTTNLGNNMDDAFTRRLSFIIGFPFPKEAERYQIWQKIFPDSTPLGADLDLEFMARRFEIAGGNIRNIALAAAFLAAAEKADDVRMSHLIRATRREYQKIGKIILDEDLGSYASR
ncbi:ATP-binding protein [Microcoleus vaginatus]|uniref:ATP-binding protein n=1 Tax=Microcoleus vaginatus TaxID=119532 RepID=UPI001686177B|nr:ATP-binding protein [Microcoleus sp. FACHB-84]